MKQRLDIWISTPQRIESDSLMGEVDFATDQSVRPVLVDRVTSRQQIDGAMFIAATNENHRPAQRSSGIPNEILGDSAPCGTVVAAMRGLGTMGFDVGCRDATQGGDSRAVMALPHFALPQAIESFDGILQTRLARWRKNRNDAERKTQSGDATHGVWMLMGPLEHVVVIKLSIVGEPVRAPASQQRLYGAGRSAVPHDPGIGQCAMQADAGQQADQWTVGDLQILNKVEAIELRFAASQSGQVPPLGWRGSASTAHGIEGAAPFQHAVDRSARNRYGLFDGRQRIDDRLRAVLSQHAVLAQVNARSKNLRFLARRGPIPRSSRLAIGEVDTRQRLASRMLDPVTHGTDTHRKMPCDGTHGFTMTHRSDHCQPASRLGAFLP